MPRSPRSRSSVLPAERSLPRHGMAHGNEPQRAWAIHFYAITGPYQVMDDLANFYESVVEKPHPGEALKLIQGTIHELVDVDAGLGRLTELAAASPELAAAVCARPAPRSRQLAELPGGDAFDLGAASPSSPSTATSARASTTWRSPHGPRSPRCCLPRSASVSSIRSNPPPSAPPVSPARRTCLADGVRDRLADQPEKARRIRTTARPRPQDRSDHGDPQLLDRPDGPGSPADVRDPGGCSPRAARASSTDPMTCCTCAGPRCPRSSAAPGDRRAVVAERKAEYERWRRVKPPSKIGKPTDEGPSGRFGGERFAKEDEAIVRGTGASAGDRPRPGTDRPGTGGLRACPAGRHHRRALVEPVLGAALLDRRRPRHEHWRRALPRGGRRARVRPAGGRRHRRRDDADRRRSDARAGRDHRLRPAAVSEGPTEDAAAATGGPPRLMTGAMLGLASGAILVPLNSTMLAVALPSVMEEFGVGAATVASLVTLYLGAVAIALPASGSLGDRFGHRRRFPRWRGRLSRSPRPSRPRPAPSRCSRSRGCFRRSLARSSRRARSPCCARSRRPIGAARRSGSSTCWSRRARPSARSSAVCSSPGLGWRSIFIVAVPVAILAAVAVGALARPPAVEAATRGRRARSTSLASAFLPRS